MGKASTAVERFHGRFTVDQDGCWIWQGYIKPNGYAAHYVGGGRKEYAHRFSYELHNGPIPEGTEIDHLCSVRRCVNPAHLEAVTHRENLMRGDTVAARMASKTHCNHGHPLDGERPHQGGVTRYCTTCYPPTGTPNGQKTHCKWGHEFTPENTYREPSGKGRACKTCRYARTAKQHATAKAARLVTV